MHADALKILADDRLARMHAEAHDRHRVANARRAVEARAAQVMNAVRGVVRGRKLTA